MRAAVGIVVCALVGCQGRATPSSPNAIVAESVQTGGSAFTSARPLLPGDTIRVLPPATGAADAVRDTGLTISVTYDGSPARVVVTSPDGQVVSDTTRPRDTSCDDFAPDTNSDPNADGIGCLADSYGVTIHNSRPGVAYIQITSTDSGEISLGIETLVQRNFVVGDWGVRVLRLRPGQTQIFQLSLYRRREEGPIRAVSLTGLVDTTLAPR